MKHLKIILIVFIFVSCQKHKVTSTSSQMVNNWKHYKSKTELFRINIDPNSRGDQEWYINGQLDHKTSTRTWYIKRGKLEFARISAVGDIFSIDQYPQASSTHFVHEFDTVNAGQTYMILGGHYFVGAN